MIAIVSRNPVLSSLFFLAGIGSMGTAAITHLITLPMEIDASFHMALPILIKDDYIDKKDHNTARKILKVAAMTYVAASLASLLNLWRWIAILKR